MKKFSYEKLSHEEQNTIEGLRIAIREKIRSVPEEGIEIDYFDKKFLIYRNVFWPHEDAKALVRNYTIKHGETVLDIGTGSGVLAVLSAYKGAQKVLAIDINPEAIKLTKINAQKHGFENIIEARLSDGVSNLKLEEKFDVIISNPPMTDKTANDLVEATMYDSGFKLHKDIFQAADKHLKPNGRLYLTQANFGSLDKMLELANSSNFNVELVGENKISNDSRVFYAFKLTKK